MLDIAVTGQHYIAEGNGILRPITTAERAKETADLAAAFTAPE